MGKTIIIDKQAPNVLYVGSISGLGSGITINLETAQHTNSIIGNTAADFGNDNGVGQTLSNNAGGTNTRKLLEGSDYKYDNPLNSGTYNLYDTGDSGALTGLFRVVNNGYNIVSASGLNISSIIAKNLQGKNFPPKQTECFIDPLIGKFTLPRPAYWNKCESTADLTNPNIVYGTYDPTYTMNDNNNLEFTAGKFGNGISVKSSYLYDGVLTIYPFGNPGVGLSKGTMLAWVKLVVSGNGRATSKLYISETTFLEIQIDYSTELTYIALWVNGIKESSISSIDANYHHYYITWDTSAGLTGSKTIKVYKDNVLILSSINVPIPGRLAYYLFSHAADTSANSKAYIDGLKIWDHVLCNIGTTTDADAAWDYNSGAGLRDSMHIIYGAVNNYQPFNLQTGYYYVKASITPATIPNPGTNTAILLENATYTYGQSVFGSEVNMKKNDYSDLVKGVDFIYGQRLDNAGAGVAIMDTVLSDFGSTPLNSGKYIRLVQNSKNIIDPTGLNLQVYAKNLSNRNQTPPKTQCWIDPGNGRFILPRPNYYSRCETIASLTSPEIQNETPSIATINNLAIVAGKWGNCVRMMTTASAILKPFGSETGSIIEKGTYSGWHRIYTAAFQSSFIRIMIGLNTEFRWDDGYFYMYINGTSKCSLAAVTRTTMHHFYCVWDKAGGLTGDPTKPFYRAWLDGVELAIPTAAQITFATSQSLMIMPYHGGDSWGYYDNMKIWKDAIEDVDGSNRPWNYVIENATAEDPLHPIYGAGVNYKPTNSGIGYYKAGGSGTYILATL